MVKKHKHEPDGSHPLSRCPKCNANPMRLHYCKICGKVYCQDCQEKKEGK